MKTRLIFATIALIVMYMLNALLFNYGIIIPHDSISPHDLFLFHAVASFVVLLGVEILLRIIPNQAGMLYLALVFIKTGVFALVFKNSLFEKEQLEMSEKLLLIVPMFSFLLLEVVFLAIAMKALDKKVSLKEQLDD